MAKVRASKAQDAGTGYAVSPRIYKVDQIYRDSTDAAQNQFHR